MTADLLHCGFNGFLGDRAQQLPQLHRLVFTATRVELPALRPALDASSSERELSAAAAVA